MNDGQVVANGDVGCGRKQRVRRAVEISIGRAAAEAGVRNAIVEAPSGKELLIAEPVGLSFPKFADWGNSLTIPRRVDLRFVNQRGMNEPGIRELNAISGTQAIGGNRGQWRGDEGAVRVNQIVIVMEIATIDAVLFVEPVINPRVILAPIERVRLLEGGVVGCWWIGVSHPQAFHGA